MNKLNVDKVYICHYKKLEDRKIDLENHLNDNGIFEYQFVENFDKNEWNKDEIEEEYPNIFKVNDENRFLSDSEISLALKHSWIIQDTYKNKYKSSLVLEDDVLLCYDFIELFNDYKSQLPDFWDLAWVGSCYNLHAEYDGNNNVYKNNHGSRCTHCFIISQQFCEKVISDVKNINDSSDFFYNKLVKKFDLNNYWFEPCLAFQDIKYQSAISGRYWPSNLMQ
jgi:GR25 family glycosyltransferase involved in LPS biosynthesis